MADGRSRAPRGSIETIGVYLGYALAHYADFYDMEHMPDPRARHLRRRAATIIIAWPTKCWQRNSPTWPRQVALHLPDEKSRRVGQAIAAASLPEIRKL